MKPRMKTLALSLLAALGIVLLLPGTGAAQDGPATRYLRQRHEEMNRVMRRPATTDEARARRAEEINVMLRELLDYEELSRRALGAHWTSHTPEQRERFVTLLRQLVERNYQQNLERILEAEVTYVGEESLSDGVIVRSEARSRTERRAPPIEITYSMRLAGTQWRVFDIGTDGVSLVRNYQNQFNRIITANGWDELIRRMEQRLAAGASE